MKLDWNPPPDVVAIYAEVIIESSVPGTLFAPIGFNGGYLGIQDGPDHLDGHQRIIFHVDNVQMMPLKRTVTFSSSTISTKAPIPIGEQRTPCKQREQREPDSEPNSDQKGVSPPQNHFIGTPPPNSKPKRATTIGNAGDLETQCQTSESLGATTPRHFAGESNIQVLHFGPRVNVSQSSEAVHFKDDFTRWELGETLKFFVVHAGRASSHTCYAAYVNVGPGWQHLASVSVAAGKPFVEHCSFIEDTRRDGASTGQERKAQFGPVWFRRPDGTWQLTKKATFQAGADKSEGQQKTNVYTQSVAGTGRRVLATGGDLKDAASAESKIGTTRTVAEPANAYVPDVPDFPQWFFEMPHA